MWTYMTVLLIKITLLYFRDKEKVGLTSVHINFIWLGHFTFNMAFLFFSFLLVKSKHV